MIQDAASGDTIVFNLPTSDSGYNATTHIYTIGTVLIALLTVVLLVVALHYCDDACTAFLTSKIDEFARKMETINRVLRPSRADAP
jgi:hypothetical protein